MRDTQPTKEMCLRWAEQCFEQHPCMKVEKFGWQYLFMWAMYEHWIEEYWTKE